MTGNRINDNHRDALFKLVFGDHPENALSLYNAINGTDYTNVEDLEIRTLKDAVYISIKNDVAFLFNDDLSLYEHQSTYSQNMPLRGLGYFADLYQIYLEDMEYKARIYDNKRVSIPAPRYYVFYNGTAKRPEREDLRLSDAYEGEGDIEITAHMINVNKGSSSELMDRCRPMADYSEFIYRVRDNIRRGYTKEKAVDLAIDSCIDDHIMEELLRRERAKVANTLYTALSEEEIAWLRNMQMERATREGLEQGLEQGIKQGIEQGKLESVDNLVKKGVLNVVAACDAVGVDMEEYQKYAEMKESQDD